jgi:multidrug efflux pump subunit AcrA (membrane-fusion protein)
VRLPRLPSAGLALVAFAIAASGCAEVESNVVEVYPYEVKEVEGKDLKRVTMTDDTAARIELQTAKVRVNGERMVVPHVALIYNPDGDVFVYTRPEPRTYIRAPVEVRHVAGDRVVLSDGPPSGTDVVTVGAAELLATEYEILNQHP